MTADFIHDRGRGPEIVGTRITIYHLLPYFLDPSATEAYICQVNDLTAEQVSAARAYALNHVDRVLAEHSTIEARIAAGNPPKALEQARKTRDAFAEFKHRLTQRDSARAGAETTGAPSDNEPLPAFRDWIAEREAALRYRPATLPGGLRRPPPPAEGLAARTGRKCRP